MPFQWDEQTIWHGLNFTLTTSLGAIDLLGEITGGGGFDDLLPHKDLEVIAELEVILEERQRNV